MSDEREGDLNLIQLQRDIDENEVIKTFIQLHPRRLFIAKCSVNTEDLVCIVFQEQPLKLLYKMRCFVVFLKSSIDHEIFFKILAKLLKNTCERICF